MTDRSNESGMGATQSNDRAHQARGQVEQNMGHGQHDRGMAEEGLGHGGRDNLSSTLGEENMGHGSSDRGTVGEGMGHGGHDSSSGNEYGMGSGRTAQQETGGVVPGKDAGSASSGGLKSKVKDIFGSKK